MDKCAIFIDGGYFSKVLKNEFDLPRIDYLKLSENISKGYKRTRTYYYNCMPYKSDPPTIEEKKRFDDMQRFIESLKKLPNFEIRLGKLKKRHDEKGNIYFVQKGVDILLAVDLIRLGRKGRIDYAILVTGDNDFVPVIKTVKDEGVIIYLYSSHASKIGELRKICDQCFFLDRDLINNSRQE